MEGYIMAYSGDTAFVNQYKANFEILSQQMGSKLEPYVRIEMQNGEYAFYDQISKVTTLTENPARNADTALLDTPHSRRRVSLNSYFWAELIDKFDEVKMLADPKSPYAENASYAFGRQKDKSILACAAGTAYTGKTGSTSTTFSTDMIISASGTGTYGTYAGSTSVLNVDKLAGAALLLDSQDVQEEGRVFVAHPRQKHSLLANTLVTSADYNSVKALVNGSLDTFYGFKFVWTTEVTVASGTGIYTCYAWGPGAILLAVGQDDYGFNARVEERADKNYSTQLFNSMFIGCTRMDEDRIVKIECL